LEDRRNVGENSCNSGDGTDQTGPTLDVYDDDEVCVSHLFSAHCCFDHLVVSDLLTQTYLTIYVGWNFNSGNYLFTTDTK